MTASTAQYDIFISYARVNDHAGWVTDFQTRLHAVVDEKLGRSGTVRIFFDRSDLPPDQGITPTIHRAASSSTVFLLILSDGYLASDWCRQELEIYLRACGDRKREPLVFSVVYDPVDACDKPGPIQDLQGFDFFQRDGVKDVSFPLASDDQEFNAQLYYLRSRLVHALKEASGSAMESEQPVVYLAATGSGLANHNRDIATFLIHLDYRIALGSPVPQRSEMRNCIACVQLLAGDATWSAKSESLLDEAADVFDPDAILFWRAESDSGANPNELGNHTATSFGIHSGHIEEFKSFLIERLGKLSTRQRLEARRKTPAHEDLPEGSGYEFVLVKACAADEPVAHELGSLLDRSNIGRDIDLNGMSLQQACNACDYDGVLMVYGGCPQDWVQQRIRECRNVIISAKDAAPECAIVVTAPNDRPLRARYPRIRVIDQDDMQGLTSFVAALVQRRSKHE